MVVVSLKQMYVGHAKETAMFVAGSYPAAWAGKWVVIVDDDIDPVLMQMQLQSLPKEEW